MTTTRGIFDSDDLVTGEAVALELPAAGIGVRLASGAIDYAVSIAVFLLFIWLGLTATANTDIALISAAMILAMAFSLVGIPATLETLLGGRTLGKLALGLRTVRDDAGPIGFRHALIRALVGYVELWVFLGTVAVISAVLSDKSKRLGDFAAGTYVVRERVRVGMVPGPQMPVFLDGWARGADIATMPDALAMGVRQFLARAQTLSPQARVRFGQQLYADTLRYVSPSPPTGAHPEYVLAAVMADRRRRDAEKLARDEQLHTRLLAPDTLDQQAPPPPYSYPTGSQGGPS